MGDRIRRFLGSKEHLLKTRAAEAMEELASRGTHRYELDYVPCGDPCAKCGNGGCTKSEGHARAIDGHKSNKQAGGCGHDWPA